MARRSDISLSKELICEVALQIVDEGGLEALTMRSLARKLEVQAPSLYAHYRDKSELMSALAAVHFIEARDAVYRWDSPSDWLVKVGIALYNVLKTRRDASTLFALSQPPTRADELTAETAVIPLTEAGFSPCEAVEMQAAVIALAVGMSLDHSDPVTSAYLKRYFDLDKAFEKALLALVAGLTERPINQSASK